MKLIPIDSKDLVIGKTYYPTSLGSVPMKLVTNGDSGPEFEAVNGGPYFRDKDGLFRFPPTTFYEESPAIEGEGEE